MNKRIIYSVLGGVMAIILCAVGIIRTKNHKQYFVHQGHVFGTYYNIRYENTRDLQAEIEDGLREVDMSLSMFNDSSIISRINRNEDVVVDSLFERIYVTANQVSRVSHGAFDITVAPLVHAWGFGKSKTRRNTPSVALIDSLLQIVGYEKLHLEQGHLRKDDARITLDASAIAKGFGCDVVAGRLAAAGCDNYLVDIGGEVVAKGVNNHGEKWRIGIDVPAEDSLGGQHGLQDIIQSDHIAMATSGNYRQFYYDGDVRRSHTIDPRNGYPVNHSLLSATIVAADCMTADALATACMVLGEEDGMKMINDMDNVEAYFIVSKGDSMLVITSNDWLSLLAAPR